MKRLVLVLVAAAAAACASPGGAGSTRVQQGVDAAISKVYPTLVRIHVVTLEYGGGREQKFEAAGSGAIVSEDGYVVTNHHVAGRATLITCTMSNREEIGADLIGTDALADIAVLKLRLNERKDPTAPVPVAKWGDSNTLRVGDPVMAMGCPLALSQSVTLGIVSNLDLIMSARFTGQMELDGENVGSVVKWIGHDAMIQHGNSGGPLVNVAGEIVGVNEIGVGLSGAIPSNLARGVADELIAKRECTRSWTGLEIQPLLKGSKEERGVLVSGVVAGGPAARAGLQSGDVLVSVGGASVSAHFDEEIPAVNAILLGLPVGAAAPFVVRRDGTEMTLDLTTEIRGRAHGDDSELRSWGMTATDITPLMAVWYRRAARSGALVWSPRDGGPAADAKPPLQGGDVVTEVAGQEVLTLADLVRVTDGITKGKDKPVPTLVAFERRNEKFLSVVKLGPEPEDRSLEAKKAWFPSAFQVLTTPLAEQLGLKGRTGVRITQVYPGTTVEAAGLLAGDVLTAIDGDAIQAQQPEDMQVFPHMVRQRKIGSRSELTVHRGGKEMKIEVELPARPPEGRELATYKNETFEFTVREISFKDRVDNRWTADQKGAVVGTAVSGGWAAFAGLDGGDLIVAIDGRAVELIESVKSILKDVEEKKPAHVAFQVRRGVRTLFVEVQPAWPAAR